MSDYSNHYSEDSFWEKVKKYAIKAGKEVIEKALILYNCLLDSDTPAWAKGIIVAALGYFIFPADVVPDVTPVVGYSDDLGVLAGALLAVAAQIKEDHKKKAQDTLQAWFG